jgi:hypothetical protein
MFNIIPMCSGVRDIFKIFYITPLSNHISCIIVVLVVFNHKSGIETLETELFVQHNLNEPLSFSQLL